MKNIAIYRDEGTVDIEPINNFEKFLNRKLSDSYKKLLSNHNGLRPKENIIAFFLEVKKMNVM